MTDDGFEEVIGDAAEEEEEKGRPLDRLTKASEKSLLAEAVAQHGVA